MDAALWVHLRLEFPGDVSELGSLEDVEVVVRSVASSVAFSSNGSTCEDRRALAGSVA